MTSCETPEPPVWRQFAVLVLSAPSVFLSGCAGLGFGFVDGVSPAGRALGWLLLLVSAQGVLAIALVCQARRPARWARWTLVLLSFIATGAAVVIAIDFRDLGWLAVSIGGGSILIAAGAGFWVAITPRT